MCAPILRVHADHLEHPNRVRVLNSMLEEAGLVDRCIKLPSKLVSGRVQVSWNRGCW